MGKHFLHRITPRVAGGSLGAERIKYTYPSILTPACVSSFQAKQYTCQPLLSTYARFILPPRHQRAPLQENCGCFFSHWPHGPSPKIPSNSTLPSRSLQTEMSGIPRLPKGLRGRECKVRFRRDDAVAFVPGDHANRVRVAEATAAKNIQKSRRY